MRATAFAPGHISGFFQPIYHHNIYQSGSRGAGVNLNLGVTATIEIQKHSSQKISIFVENHPVKVPVVTRALEHLLEDELYDVSVFLTVELPVSQGFGISAASGLSSCLALCQVLNFSFQKAWMAAHYAEIEMKTGLGDVAAQIQGGIEIRDKPGIPPWGHILSISSTVKDLVICTMDTEIQTPTLLQNKKKMEKIAQLGKTCTDTLVQQPTFPLFMTLSKDFTMQSQLGSDFVLEAIKAVSSYGKCSMCMLGNSVFSIGKTEKIKEVLSSYGTIYCCQVEKKGCRIIPDD